MMMIFPKKKLPLFLLLLFVCFLFFVFRSVFHVIKTIKETIKHFFEKKMIFGFCFVLASFCCWENIYRKIIVSKILPGSNREKKLFFRLNWNFFSVVGEERLQEKKFLIKFTGKFFTWKLSSSFTFTFDCWIKTPKIQNKTKILGCI